MAKGLETLSRMEYAGRVIIIGKSPNGSSIVMYAITGRSPSSQARRLVIDEKNKSVFVKPTDEEALKTGQVDLLVYSSLMYKNGITVSNGKQTNDIAENLSLDMEPVEVLLKGLKKWDYEPDEPNYTPRISGCITSKGAALSVVKRAPHGKPLKYYFDVPLIEAKGKLIATYTGANEKPIPSFVGEPLDVELPHSSAGECAEAMYQALGPKGDKPDYRVSCAVAFIDKNGNVAVKVKNKH